MKCILQRVRQASVSVEGQVLSEIGQGLLVFFGVEKTDTETQLDYFVKKILNLRIFSDTHGKMNLSIQDLQSQDIQGELLVVSQFTLASDCRKGNRPGFDNAKPPSEALALYDRFVQKLRVSSSVPVQTGQFGADMQIALINDGPVTFILDDNNDPKATV